MPQGTSYEKIILGDGPIAYWRLGETSGSAATDEIGSFNGTYAGSPSLDQTTLIESAFGDGSVIFSGAGERLDITGFPLGTGNPTQFSIEAWISGWSITSGVVNIFVQREASGSDANAAFYIVSGGSVRFNKSPPSGGTLVGSVIDTGIHHLVYTEDGATRTIYIDGSQDVQDSGGEVFSGSIAKTEIGNYTFGTNTSTVNLDEMAIYDYPLTPNQVARHYVSGA